MLDELLTRFNALPEDQKQELKELTLKQTEGQLWFPNPGPQTEAFFTEADETFYGGAAGGGKTDVEIGLALVAHTRSLILRREGTDLRGIEQRLTDIIGTTDGYNQQRKEWRIGNRQTIELGSCQHENDKMGYQGRPHDLKCFDEITQFTRTQYQYIIGWNRSAIEGQRCRVVCAGNPPSTPEGQWVKFEWGPWLDKSFPKGYTCLDKDGNPCQPERAKGGELRYFTTDEKTGETIWVDKDWRGIDADGNVIEPKSRTFIPAKLADNPFLGSEYRAKIAAMPEPLRSQLLYGDFDVAEKDQLNQVIPTAWIRAAQERWTEEGRKRPMISIGVDVAQGGDDTTALAPRHSGDWFDEIKEFQGSDTPDGPSVSAHVVNTTRNGAITVIDMGGGYGQSAHDHLRDNRMEVEPFNASNTPTRHPPGGKLRYVNKRAQAWWELRMKLDPANAPTIALPVDSVLAADLAAPTWKLTPRGIQIESKEDIRKRIGRSTNRGDAVVMANHSPRDDVEAEARRYPNAIRKANARQEAMSGYDPIWNS